MINHAAGIFADMSVDGPSIGTLVAIIDRAKNLPNRKTMGKQNPYCAARLGKEAKKTETDLRGGQTPRWYLPQIKDLATMILTGIGTMNFVLPCMNRQTTSDSRFPCSMTIRKPI